MGGRHVYSLPPGAPFAAEFARGWHNRYCGLSVAEVSRATVLVGTAEAARGIERALADEAPRPGLLPRVRVIQDLADEPSLDLPPAISPLRRVLHLTRLVERFLSARRETGRPHAPLSAAVDLAEALAFQIDQFHDHGVAPDALDRALAGQQIAEGAARHWQESLAFLDIVRRAWPAIRDEEEAGALDPRARQALAIDRQIARWHAEPPGAPVIVAGSTGSVGTTARLMSAVARLKHGAVVLPGFDPATDADIWRAAGADHPLGPFRTVMDLLEMSPADVSPWQVVDATPRIGLMAQAMRPAPVTDHWHEAADDLRAVAEGATAGLALVEAADPRREAGAIAMAIREAVEIPDRTVTLITPDGALARRVAAELDRFGIVPDDTVGAPLAQSVPGTLLRLLLAATAREATTLEVAALLQHPLVCPGLPRGRHLTLARRYERKVLRRHAGAISELPGPKDDRDPDPEIEDWLGQIEEALGPVREVQTRSAPLADGVTALREALIRLTDAGDGLPAVWEGNGGEDLRRFLAELERDADALAGSPVGDLATLLGGLMRGRQLRPRPREVHPRVRITGPREVRTEDADVLILGGLNDGNWPAAADPGPWLSRPMHEALGLPVPERATGLSAHDFLMGICRPDVLLTRSVRADGAPTVPSRWLVRLETLLDGIGAGDALQGMRNAGRRYLEIADRLDRPAAPVPRAARPRPVPPPDAIPRKLPATQLETLLRDAYAVYARYVLGLRPVDALGRRPDVRERGQLLHRVVEGFARDTDPWPGLEAAREILMQGADHALTDGVLPPDLRRAWRARVARFARWLVEAEEARRQASAPLAQECTGEIPLQVAGSTFTLTARADRIDRGRDGRGLIYDYKSGQPPSDSQIKLRFNQQLHLAAAILRDGGFEGVGTLAPASGAYIGLSGSGAGGVERRVDDIGEQIDDYLAELRSLLSAYLDGAPWVSRGRPELLAYASDYDHLARVQEWSDEDDA